MKLKVLTRESYITCINALFSMLKVHTSFKATNTVNYPVFLRTIGTLALPHCSRDVLLMCLRIHKF